MTSWRDSRQIHWLNMMWTECLMSRAKDKVTTSHCDARTFYWRVTLERMIRWAVGHRGGVRWSQDDAREERINKLIWKFYLHQLSNYTDVPGNIKWKLISIFADVFCGDNRSRKCLSGQDIFQLQPDVMSDTWRAGVDLRALQSQTQLLWQDITAAELFKETSQSKKGQTMDPSERWDWLTRKINLLVLLGKEYKPWTHHLEHGICIKSNINRVNGMCNCQRHKLGKHDRKCGTHISVCCHCLWGGRTRSAPAVWPAEIWPVVLKVPPRVGVWQAPPEGPETPGHGTQTT